MDDSVWDRTCRLVVTLETDGGHQPPATVPNTVVPIFTGDGGSNSNPNITASDYDAPIELGGVDIHSTAFLFAYTLGNRKGIRQYHIGPFKQQRYSSIPHWSVHLCGRFGADAIQCTKWDDGVLASH